MDEKGVSSQTNRVTCSQVRMRRIHYKEAQIRIAAIETNRWN